VLLYIILGIVALLIAFVIYLRKTTPSTFPPGTRAFEAQMIMPAILAKLASLRQQLATGAAGEKAKLERQIAYLEDQKRQNEAIIQARDVSPGKGYVGYGALPD
jgi:hypothetical protein